MVQNVALSTFTSSAIVVWGMQKLKRASWFPLAQEGRAKLNRLCSLGAAAIGALSIEWVWDPQIRALTIHIPTMWAMMVAGWHWLNHYAMQETIYQATANPVSQPANPAAPAMQLSPAVQTSAPAPSAKP